MSVPDGVATSAICPYCCDGPLGLAAATPETPTRASPAGVLDTRHTELLRALLAKETWERVAVEALARAQGLLPNAALETINDAAFERFEEPIIEGEDPVYVSVDMAGELVGERQVTD